MKVSFLVTYFNQEKYVRQSLDSILAIDKPFEWEILVGDDGSSDSTVEIVNEYIEKYGTNIKLYIMPRNVKEKYNAVKRASENRINLLRHCTGDCFCTLDGDDYYCDTEFVKDAIRAFENYPDVSLVAFGYCLSKAGRIIRNKRLSSLLGQIINTEKYVRNYYIHAGACVHRILWDDDRINYINSIGYYDDNDIVMNTINFGKIYSVRRIVYVYRQTGESIYTSMSRIEQSVLNLLGLDVDKQLLGESFYSDLVERNRNAILTTYIWRRRLQEIIGTEKYNNYIRICEPIKNSLLYRILKYNEINDKEKSVIHNIIKKIIKEHLLLATLVYIDYLIKGSNI